MTTKVMILMMAGYLQTYPLITRDSVVKFLFRNENRGVQYTTRLELGTRLTGTKADLELFVGAERRLDASLIDFVPVSWAIAGFRIVSK